MCGLAVYQVLLIAILPNLFVSSPACSKPSPLVYGLLPIDNRTTSASRVSVLPSLLTLACTPFSLLLVPPSNLELNLNLIPYFLRILVKAKDTSLSRNGQILSVCWITVTSVPSLAYTDPISRPITPPPTTIILLGISLRSRAPVEVTTYSSSISSKPGGRLVGSLPVAIITFLTEIS